MARTKKTATVKKPPPIVVDVIQRKLSRENDFSLEVKRRDTELYIRYEGSDDSIGFPMEAIPQMISLLVAFHDEYEIEANQQT